MIQDRAGRQREEIDITRSISNAKIGQDRSRRDTGGRICMIQDRALLGVASRHDRGNHAAKRQLLALLQAFSCQPARVLQGTTRSEWVTYEHDHDPQPVPFGKYVRVDGSVAPGGTVIRCLRCGAIRGTKRYAGACRAFRLPGAEHERARPGVPRKGVGEGPFDEALAEYFEQADSFGGLHSLRFGGRLESRRSGGSGELPAYMHHDALRARLVRTWRALTRLPWSTQQAIRAYYEGRQPDTEEVRTGHELFGRHFGRREASPTAEPGPPGRSWTVVELATRAGVTPQYVRRLLAATGIGRRSAPEGRGRPAIVVTDQDIAELLAEAA